MNVDTGIIINNVIDPSPEHTTLELKRHFGCNRIEVLNVDDIDPDLEPELIILKRDYIPPSRFFTDCYETLSGCPDIRIQDKGQAARLDVVTSVSCDSVDIYGNPTELFRKSGLQSRFRFNICAFNPHMEPTNIDHCTKNLLSQAVSAGTDSAIRQEKRLYTSDVRNGFVEFLARNPDLPEDIRQLTIDQMSIAAIVLCGRASYSFWDESLLRETGLVVEYETSSDACLNVSPLRLAHAVGTRYNFEAEAARLIGPSKKIPHSADEQKEIIQQSVSNVRRAMSYIGTGISADVSKIEQAHFDVASDVYRRGVFGMSAPTLDVDPDMVVSGIQATLLVNLRPDWITLESSRVMLASLAKNLPPRHAMLPGNFSMLDDYPDLSELLEGPNQIAP